MSYTKLTFSILAFAAAACAEIADITTFVIPLPELERRNFRVVIKGTQINGEPVTISQHYDFFEHATPDLNRVPAWFFDTNLNEFAPHTITVDSWGITVSRKFPARPRHALLIAIGKNSIVILETHEEIQAFLNSVNFKDEHSLAQAGMINLPARIAAREAAESIAREALYAAQRAEELAKERQYFIEAAQKYKCAVEQEDAATVERIGGNFNGEYVHDWKNGDSQRPYPRDLAFGLEKCGTSFKELLEHALQRQSLPEYSIPYSRKYSAIREIIRELQRKINASSSKDNL